ncbi:FERM, ARHGEF and pleckstrin domain-containing protein 1-like [Trichoplusia ni]|uniref:FERM, ARHGEF and pleckstrin domain-containing protein 1-like n=1 Tax=Trichoplusia ni TaxID=7111 RepID=A0A7E5VEA4_TRINI|nr:FERM, ARHGEF and pleckstrin domain-containing protein 1-like [Trichoplusia ni]
MVQNNDTSEEDNTVSSASLCMSPTSVCDQSSAGPPICASTPLVAKMTNGHDTLDNKTNGDNNNDTLNGNVSVTIVSESVNSMDVLSGGESDAGDTLSRRNNNSISSGLLGTLREVSDAPRKRNMDITYFVAKELLMTERTYKRDLELVTVKWSSSVSELAQGGAEAGAALARACLALEPLALRNGKLLARLDRLLANTNTNRSDGNDTEEPEYKKIADVLYEHLSSTIDAYSWYCTRAGSLVGVVESVRRRGLAAGRAAARFDARAPLPLAALLLRPLHRRRGRPAGGVVESVRRRGLAAGRAAARFDARAPLPLAALLLRPLHRALHLERLATELFNATESESAAAALELASKVAAEAREQLQHGENHAALCQLQRDITGYDKILVAEREFIRMGCVYKHSSRGLQQRMLFLFSDVLVITSKSGTTQFRAHSALPLHALQLKTSELPHSFTLTGEDINLLMSAPNDVEYLGWYNALQNTIENARDKYTDVDTELTPYEAETAPAPEAPQSGGGLAHVCWHRVTSLDTQHLHLAMRTQLSGYLLRKFKKSPGWQKLWVVFAVSTLFFYKSWQDETPLASLPLLGYSVGAPTSEDGIDKDFVFKLQFKNHVYFFRADSYYTFNRWTEVLQTATMQPEHH